MMTLAYRAGRPAFQSITKPSLRMTGYKAGLFAQNQARFLGTIPQPPGGIVGSVNDAVKVPPVDRGHGSFHWTFERIIAVGIVPLTILPFASGSLSPVLDAVFGSLLIAHSHIGFESCIIDYIPKRVYGQLHNVAIYALWTGSVAALVALYELETNDVGLTETLRLIWNA